MARQLKNKVTSKHTKTGETVTGSASDIHQVIEGNAKDAPVDDVLWNASELQADSDTHLEDDEGVGGAAIIRQFEFAVNLEAFQNHPPSLQDLFNHHIKQIEVTLWTDGLKIMQDVEPRISFNKNKTKYRIWVGAKPQKGHILREVPQTLSQIAKS